MVSVLGHQQVLAADLVAGVLPEGIPQRSRLHDREAAGWRLVGRRGADEQVLAHSVAEQLQARLYLGRRKRPEVRHDVELEVADGGPDRVRLTQVTDEPPTAVRDRTSLGGASVQNEHLHPDFQATLSTSRADDSGPAKKQHRHRRHTVMLWASLSPAWASPRNQATSLRRRQTRTQSARTPAGTAHTPAATHQMTTFETTVKRWPKAQGGTAFGLRMMSSRAGYGSNPAHNGGLGYRVRRRLFRRLLLGHRLLSLRLLGLALLPPGQLPDRALDSASGPLGRVAHRLGGALDSASGLLGRVAHRLGGSLDAASGLLGRVAHRLGGALDHLGGSLDRCPADFAERLRASGQPVGYGGDPGERGLRGGLLCGLHQRAANLRHDLRDLLGLRHLGEALPGHGHRLRASLVAAEPRRQAERRTTLLRPAQYVAPDRGCRQSGVGGLVPRRLAGVLFFGHRFSFLCLVTVPDAETADSPGRSMSVGAPPEVADLRHFLLPGFFAFGEVFVISLRLLKSIFSLLISPV